MPIRDLHERSGPRTGRLSAYTGRLSASRESDRAVGVDGHTQAVSGHREPRWGLSFVEKEALIERNTAPEMWPRIAGRPVVGTVRR